MLSLIDYVVLFVLMFFAQILVTGLAILYVKGKVIYLMNDLIPKLGKALAKKVFHQIRSMMGNAAKKEQSGGGGGGFDIGSLIGGFLNSDMGKNMIGGLFAKKPPGV